MTRACARGTGGAIGQVAPRVDLAVELRVGTRAPEQLDEATRGAVDDLGSAPFSKRADASMRRPRRRELSRRSSSGRTTPSRAATSVVRVVDLGRRAAHDAGDADGDVVAVADQQVVGR